MDQQTASPPPAPARLGRLLGALFLAALVSATGPLAARAADEPALARRIIEGFVVPRTEALAAAAADQRAAWTSYCAGPRAASGIAALRDAFGRTADAWAGVEMVRFGPVAEGTRYERIAHWPERRNAIGRGLAGLLARPGTEGLATLTSESVAVQGLSALERVLYEPADGNLLTDPGPAGLRRCAVGAAIASALADVTSEVRAAWVEGPDPARERLARPDAARETLTRTATDAATALRQIIEAKIALPLGKSAGEARPAVAEFARSGRTNRAIVQNLAAVEDLARLVLDADAEGSGATFGTLSSARSIAETMQAPIGDLAADPKTRSRVVLLRSAVQSAMELAGEALPAALGITIGFNSLDGD